MMSTKERNFRSHTLDKIKEKRRYLEIKDIRLQRVQELQK